VGSHFELKSHKTPATSKRTTSAMALIRSK
jgi:hypothetical protein